MPTLENIPGAKSAEIQYVLKHSSQSCPSCCLHSSSWLGDDDALCMHWIGIGVLVSLTETRKLCTSVPSFIDEVMNKFWPSFIISLSILLLYYQNWLVHSYLSGLLTNFIKKNASLALPYKVDRNSNKLF